MIEFQDITLGKFIPGHSCLHRLDPRTKLFCATFIMIITLWIHHLESLIPFLAGILAIALAARIPSILLLKNLKPFFLLFLVTVVLHAFFTPAPPSIQLVSGLTLHLGGIAQGFFYSLRIALMILAAGIMTLTTSPMDLTDAIEKILWPFRKIGVPAHEIAMMLSIAIRFIPIFIDEADRIQKAQMSRGINFHGSLFSRIRSVVPLVIPLFISAFRKANDLALAMDARCYRGGVGRTSYHQLRFRTADAVAGILVVSLSVPWIWIQRTQG